MNKQNLSDESIVKLFNLKNKICIISGGGGFLGYYIASAFLELGAKVYLLDIDKNSCIKNQKKLNKKYSNKAKTIILNNNSFLVFKTSLEKELKNIKKVDIFINTASYTIKNFKGNNNFFETVEKYDFLLWQESLNQSLNSFFIFNQVIGSKMSKKNNGSIINIASDVGVISPDHRIYEADKTINYKGVKFNTPLSYSASKSAIISMTRYLATYWAKNNIRVNSVSPAGVYNKQDKEFIKVLASRIPLNRMANPSEIKGVLVFLASDASSFITGTNIMVDGGRTAW
jgi:NAD(P)-dependent dehydrogenase (short-subunit alcohol dehydrogenase family)|tara:strand:+ start:403 stop:1260 length:858 start_codon:yes stop_codon:yes gene_type:complete